MDSQLHWNLQRAFYGSLRFEGVFTRLRARLETASARQRRRHTWRRIAAWTAVAVLAAAYLLISARILLWA